MIGRTCESRTCYQGIAEFRFIGRRGLQRHRLLADVTTRRTASPVGSDDRSPAHHLGKPCSQMAGTSSPRLDVGRARARLDQYQNHSRYRILWTDHAYRHRLQAVWQRHHAANVLRYQLFLSGESSAASTFSYEIPVLVLWR
jgi:hypothetical protein